MMDKAMSAIMKSMSGVSPEALLTWERGNVLSYRKKMHVLPISESKMKVSQIRRVLVERWVTIFMGTGPGESAKMLVEQVRKYKWVIASCAGVCQ